MLAAATPFTLRVAATHRRYCRLCAAFA